MNDRCFMELAYKNAKKAYRMDESPIGAVIVRENEVISCGYNKKNKTNDVTNHAEIIAIRKACKKLNNWRLNDCEIYITLEPCPMCASALKQARVNHIYCGLSNSDSDNFGIISSILKKDKNNSEVFITNDLAVEKVDLLMKSFFENRRNS